MFAALRQCAHNLKDLEGISWNIGQMFAALRQCAHNLKDLEGISWNLNQMFPSLRRSFPDMDCQHQHSWLINHFPRSKDLFTLAISIDPDWPAHLSSII
jgi:hypothetical protein